MLSSPIECYWSFRSPYSYLALPQLRKLMDDFGVVLKICPVRPLALRDDSFFQAARPQMIPYMAMDMQREAARHDIKLSWPDPDPVVQNMMTREISPAQPYMDQLIPLGALASTAVPEKAFLFFEEVSALIFNGKTRGWDQGTHLQDAISRAGFEASSFMQEAIERKEELISLIEQYETAQLKHHWGVPLMVYKDQPFFGQDRIDTLRWCLKQEGVSS